MLQPVTIPLWSFVLIVLFALVTLASHFLFPSVRWFFRKRAERAIAQLNKRLTRPIEPFKLASRYDMIQRLSYDPDVAKSIVEYAKKEKVPENVAFEKAQRYAREIVPAFSATAYFSVGMRLAKWLGRSLYRIRVGTFDREALEAISEDVTVVFVINHRSNMDYVLVTHLVSRAGAMSYAVGEWARVWPLSSIIRMMGAYFIRRRSRGQLYRKVLSRYVQMATKGGVTQAMFPEGGLSLTGATMPPKLGLLSYIVGDFDPSDRDVVFVPVGVNYDRVIEDRILVAANKTGERKFRPSFGTMLRGGRKYLWQRITRQSGVLGIASVGFGTPLYLSKFDGDPEALADELMRRITDVIPVLSAPMVALAITQGKQTEPAIAEQVADWLSELEVRKMPRPRRDAAEITKAMITQFKGRGFLTIHDQTVTPTGEGQDILAYYGNSIRHHFTRDEKSGE